MLRSCLQMDWQIVSQQWLSALRGKRSQRVLSRRLGLGANAVYRWESGRCAPSAPMALRLAERTGVRVDEAIFAFLGVPERDRVTGFGFATPEGVRTLLERVRGERTFLELAEATSFNRFALSRWFRGTSQPTLPQLFELLESTTHRVLDFIAAFTDPARLPSVAQAWRIHLASRNAAFDAPWSHAVLRTLELDAYARVTAPKPGWIAERLGIAIDEEERCLRLLAESRQIKREGQHWVVDEQAVVDTGQDATRARELRRFWLAEALQRFDAGARGAFGYNLFTVSDKDYEALKLLYLQYFENMRNLVATSSPGQKLVLYCGQLVEMA
jgi:transcriptional regulator with XRE-family HTH domain